VNARIRFMAVGGVGTTNSGAVCACTPVGDMRYVGSDRKDVVLAGRMSGESAAPGSAWSDGLRENVVSAKDAC
jgi:hypothetical protein